MAVKLACADMGAKCSGSFTCDTKKELMEHVALHGKTAHPEMKMTPESAAKMEKAIQTV